jgi:hypothetical protein
VGVNGTTTYIYQPIDNTWYTVTGATHTLVSITTASVSTLDKGSAVYAVDNIGEIWSTTSPYFPMSLTTYGGYTGTPEDIHLAARSCFVVASSENLSSR